jgi:hypothetical protein
MGQTTEPEELTRLDQALEAVEQARTASLAAEAHVQALVQEADAVLARGGDARALVGASMEARARADAVYLTMQRARDGLTRAVDGLVRLEMAGAILEGQKARQRWLQQKG